MTMPTIESPGQAARYLQWTLLCVLAAVAFAGCGHGVDPQPPPRPVRVLRVSAAAPAASASFAGEVTARHETELAFRVPGKLTARYVEVGDRVRKSRVLARLDPADYRLAAQGLEAQLAAARAERDFARDDLVRYGELLAGNLISPPEFDRRRTLYRTATEKTAALRAQWEQASHQLAYTELRADGEGVITALTAEAGQVVAAGQTVARLARLDEKEVSIRIPEHRIGEVRVGQAAEAVLWADGERRLRACIREVAPAADPASRTYTVKLKLLEGQGNAQLGMTATVRFPPDAARRILIPLAAVFSPQNTPEQARVWRVDEDRQRVSAVPVRVVRPAGKERVAVEGIAEGELIVTAGVHRLLEGQAVRHSPEAPAAADPDDLASAGEAARSGGQWIVPRNRAASLSQKEKGIKSDLQSQVIGERP